MDPIEITKWSAKKRSPTLVEKFIRAPKKNLWWLNQPIWKICASQIGIIFIGIRGEHKMYLNPPPPKLMARNVSLPRNVGRWTCRKIPYLKGQHQCLRHFLQFGHLSNKKQPEKQNGQRKEVDKCKKKHHLFMKWNYRKIMNIQPCSSFCGGGEQCESLANRFLSHVKTNNLQKFQAPTAV